MNLSDIISAARGDRAADLLLTDARIVDVFTGKVVEGHLAVADGLIAGIGDYPAEQTVSMEGMYVAPGFIDSHVHIESAMISVSEFARAVLPRGTTTVVADPHEIANVLGTDGIAYMLSEAEYQPMNFYFTLPSCVPATPMETAGAVLDASSLEPLLSHERIVGLGEMMNFPGVIHRMPDVLEKIGNALSHRKPVDGHAPGLSGKDLAAYIAAGISSDHECVTAEQAREKLSAGMAVMIREGTGAKNLEDLLPVITPHTELWLMFCTDDRHPSDIIEDGHLDFILQKAVQGGVDPMTAIRMATIHPARHFGLHRPGALAPGKRADLVVIEDLEAFRVRKVFTSGRLVAENGEMTPEIARPKPVACPSAMQVKMDRLDFSIPAGGETARVIELVPDQIVTRQREMAAKVADGAAVSDIERDMIKIAVVERHRATGNVGRGFVTGFGLQQGALAGSVAHDSHNIIVVGTNDSDMQAAVQAVIDMEGGLAVVSGGKVDASLPLPLAGLMSPEPLPAVRDGMKALNKAAAANGVRLADPFMTLSFLALPVIPELRITDLGLFDVAGFAHVPVFCQ